MIGDGSKQRLLGGYTSPQSTATDAMMIKVDLAAHQAMSPVGAHGKALAEQIRVAGLIGTAHEDHLSAKRRMQVEFEVRRHRDSRRGGVGGGLSAGTVRGDVTLRARLQFLETTHAVTLPDFGLPQGVEALDGVLHPVLQWRHEHRNDPQRQTQAAHAPHRVRELVRALKHGVIVKLRIGRQPIVLPTRQQAGQGRLGAELRQPSPCNRPGSKAHPFPANILDQRRVAETLRMLPLVFPEWNGFDQHTRFKHHVESDVSHLQGRVDATTRYAMQQHCDVGVAPGVKTSPGPAAKEDRAGQVILARHFNDKGTDCAFGAGIDLRGLSHIRESRDW